MAESARCSSSPDNGVEAKNEDTQSGGQGSDSAWSLGSSCGSCAAEDRRRSSARMARIAARLFWPSSLTPTTEALGSPHGCTMSKPAHPGQVRLMITLSVHIGFIGSVQRAGLAFSKSGGMLTRAAIVVAVLHLSAGTFPVSLSASAEHLVYPRTTGELQRPEKPLARILVWGNSSAPATATAVETTKEILQEVGFTILDRETLPAGLQERAKRIRSIDEQRAELLQLGKDAGADHVVVVETADLLVPAETTRSRAAALHDERVTVKAMGTDTGNVVFRGSAWWAHPVENPGQRVRLLTYYAIARAICLPEKWEEPSEVNHGKGGCRP